VSQGAERMRKRVLMVGDGNFLAHLSRLLEVALELRDRHGHEVVFAAEGAFTRLPREAGFPVESVFTVKKETTLALAKQAGLVNHRWWYETIERSIRSDLEVMEKVKPDLVVGDMHWTLHTSAELAGVPYASITNACWTNYDASPIYAFDDHFSTRLMGRRLATRMMPRLKEALASYWALAYRRLRRRWGLDPDRARNIFQVIEGNLTLLADIPEYAPTRDLPENIHYVGPILWNSQWKDWTPPTWFQELDPARPTVYFTLGSSGEVDYFRQVRDVFSGTRFQVIMTTGGLVAGVDNLPSNIHVLDFAPGLEIMKRSDVVLNHGGNGTIYQAIAAGIPIIGIPAHVDQERNLQRVEDLGFGLKLREKTCTGETILDAVNEVVHNRKYRHAARELQQAALKYDGPVAAAELIDRFLARTRL
jgi:MGT family glycosyltransferase